MTTRVTLALIAALFIAPISSMTSYAATPTPAPAAPPSAAPAPAPKAVAAPATCAPGPMVDINTAGIDELDTLYGVGPATAKQIIDGRSQGLYIFKADVAKRAANFTDANFKLSSCRIALVDLNNDSADTIQKIIDGVGDKTAALIVAKRGPKGYANLADFQARVPGLPQKVYDNFKDEAVFYAVKPAKK